MRTLARDEWNIGIVAQSVDDVVARGIVAPVHWLPRNSWRILADPFCYRDSNGHYVILAEKMNHWSGRGEIWFAVLPDDGQLTEHDFHPYARGLGHLSYPSRIDDGSEVYLTMENYESGGLHLWRETVQGPVYIKRLLDRPAIDPTFYRDPQDHWWLFCSFEDDQPNERLHLFHSDQPAGHWEPHPANPVKIDRSAARSAGPLIALSDGRLIRPAQDCTTTYGGAITFNQIIELSPKRYSERHIRTLSPNDAYYCDGLHTIADAGRFTLIDGKRWHRNVASNIVRKVIAKGWKLHRFAHRRHMGQTIQFVADRPQIIVPATPTVAYHRRYNETDRQHARPVVSFHE